MFTCQVCGADDQDAHTLTLSCLYNLSGISDKFRKEPDGSWSIRTCKDCRGNFLAILQYWVEGNFAEVDSRPDRNILVRVHGRTVMMNTQEWEAHTARRGEAGRRPHRLG